MMIKLWVWKLSSKKNNIDSIDFSYIVVACEQLTYQGDGMIHFTPVLAITCENFCQYQ